MSKYNNSRMTWRHTNEFKTKAVQLSFNVKHKIGELFFIRHVWFPRFSLYKIAPSC